MTKNKKDRTVPLDDGLVTVLKDYYNTHFSEYDELMVDASEQYIFKSLLTVKPLVDIHRSWKKCAAMAGVPDLHRHDLRHVFCTKMVEKTGADIAVLAELLGHSSLRMVMKYRHVGNHQYSGLVQQMAEAVFHR